MGTRVCRVHELAGNDCARRLGLELVCLCDGALHAILARREDDLCTIGGSKLAALDGHRLRHHENHMVATRCGKHGKTDTGVAARRLDDRASWLQGAVCLCGIEDGLRDTVLHRSARVRCLVLAENRGLAVDEGGEVHKRGGADQCLDVLCDLHVRAFLLLSAGYEGGLAGDTSPGWPASSLCTEWHLYSYHSSGNMGLLC